jgi:hypothetical protein
LTVHKLNTILVRKLARRFGPISMEQRPTDTDIRNEARKALREGHSQSAKAALGFGVALATVCAALGSGLAVLNKFTLEWLIGLTLITVFGSVGGYLSSEFIRLSRRSQLLQELLGDERYYEEALAQARQDRLTLEAQVAKLQAEAHLVLAASQIIEKLHAATPSRQIAEVKRDESA